MVNRDINSLIHRLNEYITVLTPEMKKQIKKLEQEVMNSNYTDSKETN